MQQPSVERGATREVTVRIRRVRTEGERAAVVASLHVRAHDRALGVGRMRHQRGALEGLLRGGRVTLRQRGFASGQQRCAFVVAGRRAEQRAPLGGAARRRRHGFRCAARHRPRRFGGAAHLCGAWQR
jgi:hypothetical protein